MDLSIIIPHINDQQNLELCLKSISSQKNVACEFEVIVCDNGSTDFNIEFEKYNFNLKLVIEKNRGAAAARNAGIKEAKGKYLAFTDCDCLLDPNFVNTGIREIQALPVHHVMLGDVIIYSHHPTPNSVEAFEMIFLMDQEKCAARKDGATGNLWTSSSLFREVGEFRQFVAEDTDWCRRAAQAGASFSFNKNCLVFHPGRQKFCELREKWGRQTVMKFNELRPQEHFFYIWIFLILAVIASPFVHTIKALRSDRVSKIRYKLKAIHVLFWCRWFRAQLMLRLLLQPEKVVDPVKYWRQS
ncbi:glycosyltransferase [Sneathiella sp. P13V-1]|uniref:glycosyltransferase n=1 Tax=Sneathiella sp. P13V-1 TaxID=2697366 RepID=UPI00187BBDD0|nr:glycosyltransferase family A protein [Sneathiella sp. P13V-1]MBE7636401.1 glycosyltransferase [Sneathiella sp. P13V-1]